MILLWYPEVLVVKKLSMTASSTSRETFCYLLIPDKGFTRLLTLPADEGETLPMVVLGDFDQWYDVFPIVQAARTLLDKPVTVLSCLGWQDDSDEPYNVTAYALDALEGYSGSGRWCRQSEISAVNPVQRPILKAWFDWVNNSSALRPPWYKPGWSQRALAWVDQNLNRLGYRGFGEPQITQIRARSRACVYRIDTSAGRLYFKAVPEMFRQEPRLSRWLNEGFPKRTPRIMALNEEEGWMLIRDFGRETLEQCPDEDCIRKSLSAFGAMQAQLTVDMEAIRALGVPERRLSTIIGEIDSFAAEIPASYPDLFTASDYALLRDALPLLKQMCLDLEELGIPHSLEHGDFSLEHVVVSEGGQEVFFDWANATISHPFFSYCTFSDKLRDSYPALTGETEQSLADEYLRHWRSFADETALSQALIVARPLAALHQALLYHGRILPWIEAKWEMEPALTYYLRKLMEHLRRLEG